MQIAGLLKVSLLDFPSLISAIVFTNGCNLNCPYCHNSSIAKCKYNLLNEQDVLSYLEKRKNILEGVVISGGEPLIQNDIIPFIKKLKGMGYKIKLDTNGYLPDKLKEVLQTGLIDYVAMDIKAPLRNYNEVCGVKNMDTNKIIESINILHNSNIDYEFRTTFIKTYHKKEDVILICNLLNKNDKYYIQSFKDSEDVLDHSLESFDDSELNEILKIAKQTLPKAEIK